MVLEAPVEVLSTTVLPTLRCATAKHVSAETIACSHTVVEELPPLHGKIVGENVELNPVLALPPPGKTFAMRSVKGHSRRPL